MNIEDRYKFRGKRVDNGEWAYGDLIHRQIWKNEIVIIRSEDNGFDNYDDYEVISETVGQYTGRHDMDGVEIYERRYSV